ncbi:putative quinol monooxygenase [Halalkalibacter kiskunsagensis]|uniref:Quinol monooxygenase n=1 Tax=Halalkalibacter kiskunsagensis TaxID=1548599 RepID=A0ABV6KKM3_9BACI
MIVIHAHIHVKHEKRDLFLEKVQSLIQHSKQEDGNTMYHLYEDTNDKSKFIMVEEWKDEAAVLLHNGTDHFKQFGEQAGECFATPPRVEQFAVSKKY